MSFEPVQRLDLKRFPNVRIVILDCPYDFIEDVQVQSLLAKLVTLKISGYRAEYPYGVLPVDTSDFYGTHLLVCEETLAGLNPIAGMKSVTLERTRQFNQRFPVLTLLSEPNLSPHLAATEKIIELAIRGGEQLAYNSSLTTSPALSANRPLQTLCRDICAFLLIKYYSEYQIKHVFGAATNRFKLEKLTEFLGYERMSDTSGPLPAFSCSSFFNETVSLTHFQGAKPAAIEWGRQFEPLWEKRITLGRVQPQIITRERKVA